uniref:SCP domain-containing protein n=1 Tax=Heligmosomoides polygyrus TaxID=6339 RepID=A0A8L8K6Y5_HELPZ
LERMAEQAVENCPQTETPNSLYAQSFMHARVSGRFDEQDTILPVQNPTEDAKLGFIIEGNAVMYNGFPTFKNYSNLLRANTTRVGCSSTNCYNEQNALVQTGVCFFNSPEMKKGDAAYEAGTPCQLNSDCPAEDDICWNLALCYRNKIARKALDLHNELRSDLAMGRVKNKAGTNYPTAAVMYRLDYDLDLEQAALDEAKKWNFVRSGRGAATAILDNYSTGHVFWSLAEKAAPANIGRFGAFQSGLFE